MPRSLHSYGNGLVSSRLAKRRAVGRCADCGTKTRYNGHKGKRISDRCAPCARAKNSRWNQEIIVAAIQRFVSENGTTPLSSDWLHAESRPDYAPSTNAVQYHFGTWAAAIVAAGYPQPKVGRKTKPRRDRV